MARATASVLALLVFGAALLAVTPAAAAKPCYKQVLDDWSQDGQINGSYSPACLTKAIDKAPEDVRAYTNFEEQAEAARIAATRSLQGSAGGGSGSGDTSALEEREPKTGGGAKDETPVGWALGTRGNNADSVPLPLLILLGLATALITAGAIGFGARKLKARRAAH